MWRSLLVSLGSVTVVLFAPPGYAQDDQVEQISERSKAIDSLSPRSRDAGSMMPQLDEDGDGQTFEQLAEPEGEGVASFASADAQDRSLSVEAAGAADRDTVLKQTGFEGDVGVVVPAPNPELVDACELAALGLARAPDGIDCSIILVADERPPERELAELDLSDPEQPVQLNEVTIRRLENASPEEIARRLASGYLVNAPAAQNVGREQQQENTTVLPGGITVIPDPRSSGLSPVQVNPQGSD